MPVVRPDWDILPIVVSELGYSPDSSERIGLPGRSGKSHDRTYGPSKAYRSHDGSGRMNKDALIEPSPGSAADFDLTKRALEARVRQQEILAELGVLALRGTPFPDLN